MLIQLKIRMAGLLGAVVEGLATGAAAVGAEHAINHLSGHDAGAPEMHEPGPSYIHPIDPSQFSGPSHVDTGPTIIDQNTIFDMPGGPDGPDGTGGMSISNGLAQNNFGSGMCGGYYPGLSGY